MTNQPPSYRRRPVSSKLTQGAWRCVILSCVLLASLAFAHGDDEHEELPSSIGDAIGPPIYVAKESQFLFSVKTMLSESKSLRGQVQVLGKVIPRADGAAELYSPFIGTVRAAKDPFPLLGATVKKGDVLAVVEGSLGAAELLGFATSKAEASARIASATARADAAQRELKRLEGLSGIVSEREIQSAKTELEIAKIELEGARKAAGIAGGSGGANRFEIRSPIDGVVAEVNATAGSIVDPARPIFHIIDFSTLWVEAQIFEEDLPKIQGATEANVRPEGVNTLFSAKLLSIGRVINEQSRTVPAIFEVQNPDSLLRVGMFTRVGIVAGQSITAVIIPKSAVIDQVGRKIVYLHTQPEFFEARAVTVGIDDGDFIAVTNGLKAKERIVVDGIPTIRVAAGGR